MSNELAYFEVTGFFYDVNGALRTGDTNAAQFDVRDGFVTLSPRVGPVLVDDLDTGGGHQDTQLTLKAITGRIVDGQLCSQNWGKTPGVQVVSNCAALDLAAHGIAQLYYDVSFSGGASGLPNFSFVAPIDTTAICLTDPDLQRFAFGTTNVITPVDATSGWALNFLAAASAGAALAILSAESTDHKNVAGGYAGLDGSAKLSVNQLPIDVMEYKGLWNATTNSPTLADGTGNTGDFYRVGTGGTRNLGSGSLTFGGGDYVIYNGATWELDNNTNAVTSVAGLAGIVAATALTDALADGSVNKVYTAADKARLAATSGTNTGDRFFIPNYFYVDDPQYAGVNDDARVANARTAMGSTPGFLIFGVRTYTLTVAVARFFECQGYLGQGRASTFIDYSGTGPLFTAYDNRAWGAGGPGRGALYGRMHIRGTSTANSAGIQMGDLSSITFDDFRISNFTGTGSYGAKLLNQYTWSERITGRLACDNNTRNVIFDVDNTNGGTSSFGYLDLWLNINGNPNQDGLVLRNSASIYNSHLEMVGNFTGASGSNTGTALIIGELGAGDFACINHSDIRITVENDGSSGWISHKSIAMNSLNGSAQLQGQGLLRFFSAPGMAWVAPTGMAGKLAFAGEIAIPGYNSWTFQQGFAVRGYAAYSTSFMGGSGGSIFLSTGGNYIVATLTPGNQTYAIDSGCAAKANTGEASSWDLVYVQPASGGPSTITWPAEFIWIDGHPPALSITPGGRDHIHVFTYNFTQFFAKHVNGDAVGLAIIEKDVNYALGADEFVRSDATSGALAHTLPTAPKHGTRVGGKKTDGTTATPGNAVVFTAGGSDKINTTAGGTTVTLSKPNQAFIAQYNGADATWVITSTDVPLSQLLLVSNNLSDLLNATTARANLGAKAPDIQVFSASGTWTKPAGAAIVKVTCIGPGAGGCGGGRGPSGNAVVGGGGGGGGGLYETSVPASALTATVAVTIPVGGTGGAAAAGDNAAGGVGGGGSSATTFGTYVAAGRGFVGTGGGFNGTGGLAGGSGGGGFGGGAGGAAPVTGAAGAAGGASASGGGGAGGGITTGVVASVGGAGGAPAIQGILGGTAGTISGGAGGAGVASATGTSTGSGGGGGGSNAAGAAGAGGVGGSFGAGGGGGGASLNGSASGAGGAGGPGLCVVVTYF